MKQLITFFFLCVFTYAQIDVLEQELLRSNQSVKVSQSKIETAKSSENMSGKMPSPLVNFSYFGESIETRVGPQEWTLGISQKIQSEMTYPGQVRVTVIRETRAVNIAK